MTPSSVAELPQRAGLPIEREPAAFEAYDQERCCFCRTPTAYWFTPKDVAVCPACAQIHTAAQVPDKAAWFAAERALLAS